MQASHGALFQQRVLSQVGHQFSYPGLTRHCAPIPPESLLRNACSSGFNLAWGLGFTWLLNACLGTTGTIRRINPERGVDGPFPWIAGFLGWLWLCLRHY